ncbi:MAG: response regulator transcription factor [Candidatus Limivicinus sp.]|jgi:DNA-binding response OmpR family regulator
MRILIIEDEEELRLDLQLGLKTMDYAVDTADDGFKGLTMLEENSYDLLILDLNLPEIDGMEVLRRLRKEDRNIKILILSARDAVEDRVAGLDTGANDYLVKPFHFAELLARIRGLLRRNFETASNIISCRSVTLDRSSHEVRANGNTVELRPKEYGILEYLMSNAGRYVSQEELLEHIWDENADPFTGSVRVYMSYLRKKLAPFLNGETLIESAPTKGYIIRNEENR